ncbi:MAG: hypothetical protein ACXWNQ_08840 [Anaerolineales bacterium]
MDEKATKVSVIRQPSAYIPLGMSLAALLLVVGHAAIFGIVHEADEGTAAHIFQLLMVAQLPIVGYFVIKWLPRQPRGSLKVLALLAAEWIAAFAGVYWLT